MAADSVQPHLIVIWCLCAIPIGRAPVCFRASFSLSCHSGVMECSAATSCPTPVDLRTEPPRLWHPRGLYKSPELTSSFILRAFKLIEGGMVIRSGTSFGSTGSPRACPRRYPCRYHRTFAFVNRAMSKARESSLPIVRSELIVCVFRSPPG